MQNLKCIVIETEERNNNEILNRKLGIYKLLQ